MNKSFVVMQTLLLTILFYACTSRRHTEDLAAYKFEITDSIILKVTGSNVLCVARNASTGNLLVIDNPSGSNVFVCDSNGLIQSTFSPIGFDTGKVGGAVSNLTFFNDSIILISGNKGYSFFNFQGKLQRLLYAQNTQPVGGISKDIYIFRNQDGDTILSSVFRSPLTYETLLDPKTSFRTFVDSMRFITFHNMRTNQYEIKIGYEKGGWHKQYKDGASEPFLCAFDPDRATYFTLFTPDPTLYRHNRSDHFQSAYTVPLTLRYFDHPIQFGPGQKRSPEDYDEAVLRNSTFLSLHAARGQVLVTYRTGLPAHLYEQLQTVEQVTDLMKDNTRRFAILTDQSRQLSAEIALPNQSSGISLFVNPDKIYLYAYESPEEAIDHTKLYISRLVRDNP